MKSSCICGVRSSGVSVAVSSMAWRRRLRPRCNSTRWLLLLPPSRDHDFRGASGPIKVMITRTKRLIIAGLGVAAAAVAGGRRGEHRGGIHRLIRRRVEDDLGE